MKTLLETLLVLYPTLEYEDGFLYPDSEAEGYLTDEDGKALDGTTIVEEYFEGKEICTNPMESDPTKEVYAPASGKEYIEYWHSNDYNTALKSIK